jgi:hypothetical protein
VLQKCYKSVLECSLRLLETPAINVILCYTHFMLTGVSKAKSGFMLDVKSRAALRQTHASYCVYAAGVLRLTLAMAMPRKEEKRADSR